MVEELKGMLKKLIMIGCISVLFLLGALRAGAFFGPFRCLFPGPVGFNNFPIGGLQGCPGSFNWFSLPSSCVWPFSW